MADFTAYRVALLGSDYPVKYDGFVLALQAYATEIENGRQGQASLAANFARYIVAATGLTANLAAGGFKITGLGAPTAGGDAVNKTYADALAFSAALPAGSTPGSIIEFDGAVAFWSIDFARKAGNAGQTFNLATQASTDRSNKGASTAFVQERCGLNATTLFLRG